MSDKTIKAATPKPPRKRKTRLEHHPEVQKWCVDFINQTETASGFTPTQDQALQAFLVAALRGIGGGK